MEGYSVTTSEKVMLDDFVPRRGVLLRFRLEELYDRLKLDGRAAVKDEIGEVVLMALEAQEKLDCVEPGAILGSRDLEDPPKVG